MTQQPFLKQTTPQSKDKFKGSQLFTKKNEIEFDYQLKKYYSIRKKLDLDNYKIDFKKLLNDKKQKVIHQQQMLQNYQNQYNYPVVSPFQPTSNYQQNSEELIKLQSRENQDNSSSSQQRNQIPNIQQKFYKQISSISNSPDCSTQQSQEDYLKSYNLQKCVSKAIRKYLRSIFNQIKNSILINCLEKVNYKVQISYNFDILKNYALKEMPLVWGFNALERFIYKYKMQDVLKIMSFLMTNFHQQQRLQLAFLMINSILMQRVSEGFQVTTEYSLKVRNKMALLAFQIQTLERVQKIVDQKEILLLRESFYMLIQQKNVKKEQLHTCVTLKNIVNRKIKQTQTDVFKLLKQVWKNFQNQKIKVLLIAQLRNKLQQSSIKKCLREGLQALQGYSDFFFQQQIRTQQEKDQEHLLKQLKSYKVIKSIVLKSRAQLFQNIVNFAHKFQNSQQQKKISLTLLYKKIAHFTNFRLKMHFQKWKYSKDLTYLKYNLFKLKLQKIIQENEQRLMRIKFHKWKPWAHTKYQVKMYLYEFTNRIIEKHMKRLRIIQTQFSQRKQGFGIIQKIVMRKIFHKIKKPTARRQSCVDSISNFLAFQGKNDQLVTKKSSDKKQKEISAKIFQKSAKPESRRFTITGEIQREDIDQKDLDIKQIKQDLLESKNDGKAYKQFKKLMREKKKQQLESLGYTVVTKKSQTSEKKKKKKSKSKHRKSTETDIQIQSLLSKPSNIKKYLTLFKKEKDVEIDEDLTALAKQIQADAQKQMLESQETEVQESEKEKEYIWENVIQDSTKSQKVAKSKYGFRRDLSKIQEQDEYEQESEKLIKQQILPGIIVNSVDPIIEKDKSLVQQNQQTEKQQNVISEITSQSIEQPDQSKEKLVQKQPIEIKQELTRTLDSDKLLKLQTPKKQKKRKSANLKDFDFKLNQKQESLSQQIKTENEVSQAKENEDKKKNETDQIKQQPQGEQSQSQGEQQQTQKNQEKKSEEKTIHDILQEQFDKFQKEKEDRKKEKKKKKKKKKKKSEENSFSSTSSDDIIEEEELQRLIQNRRKAIFGELT